MIEEAVVSLPKVEYTVPVAKGVQRKIFERMSEKMGKQKKSEKKFMIPDYSILPLFLTVTMNMIAYYGGRALAKNFPHVSLETSLDRSIPWIPWTLVIYLGCYLFWIVNYLLIAREDRNSVYRFFAADFMARAICLIIFVAFPTTMARPEAADTGFWSRGIRYLYQIDAPDNLFPSIHCLTSWFCYLGIRGRKEIPVWYQKLSMVFAVLVFLSTLTTRQHVLLDVAGGVLLAEGTWRICGYERVSSLYQKLLRCFPGYRRKQRAK